MRNEFENDDLGKPVRLIGRGTRLGSECLAKPESGLFCFIARMMAFCPPSGVCSCTSGREEMLCDTYVYDASALRFCTKVL